MLDKNGAYQINSSCPHNELDGVHKDILENIDNIKVINIIEDDSLESSALITLLHTIKKSYPNITIPLLENKNSNLKGLGDFVIVETNSSEVS